MSSDFGMTDNGFKMKRLPDIKSDMEASARSALGSDATLLPDSVEGTIISVFSEIIAEQWEQLSAAYNAFNPISVTGQNLDDLAFLTGISRLAPKPSTAFLDITGIDNTVIPAGSIVRHNVSSSEFLTDTAVEIGVGFATGTASVFASARINGELDAVAGTLTIIDTPLNGWSTVINNTDANLGRLSETDSELRARRSRSLSLSGLSSLESIISSVQGIAGVSYAGAVENFTDVIDANGLSPHSFEVVVLGGSDIAVAQAIWEKKPAGIEPFGSVTALANDIFGNTHSMSFSRPTQTTIYINADISFSGKIPDDASTVLSQAIIDFVNGLLVSGISIEVSDDVINSRMYMPFNLTYTDITINSLTMSIDNITYDANDIAIAFDGLAVFDLSRITVVVT